ncbi:MAG TPA: PilZ domain-containing protein [Pyrinomonadaceae bacterium]|nr:PilZ domain-containing protein [Pyrinomonadaceae bacterium]
MPKLIRFVAAKINAIAGAHFCAPRRRAELRLKLAMIEASPHRCRARTTIFDGYTLDISATGVAILLPIARFSDELLNQSQRTLRIVLELATGAVEADAALVRYEPVQPRDGRTSMGGCLIGAQFLNMRAADRERFNQHLRSIN